MKLSRPNSSSGFTLAEMMMSMAIGSFICAAVITSSVALQKSFAAVDNYFATHAQQMRVIDFFSRDVKRSYITNASVDQLTVNCIIPNYVIQSGDPDAAAGVGTRRTPTLSFSQNTYTVNYGGSRVVKDATLTSGTATLTSATAAFTASDVGLRLAATGITMGSTISAYTNATTVTMSTPATATGAAVTVTIGNISNVSYTVSGQTIVRTENGAVTAVVSATDQLLPKSTDTQLASTEYMLTAITFLPTFNFNAANAPTVGNNARDGTTVYSRAYLRNLRRGN